MTNKEDQRRRGKRVSMLNAVKDFLPAIKAVPGVEFIGLIGSITRESPNPKDIDYVLCVMPSTDLSELGKIFRKISGRMTQIGKGADMFVFDSENGEYLGRICSYRDCRPGIRRCDADHCGMRAYLKDDLSTIRLPAFVRKKVPVELYPKLRYNPPDAPDDLKQILLSELTPPAATRTNQTLYSTGNRMSKS